MSSVPISVTIFNPSFFNSSIPNRDVPYANYFTFCPYDKWSLLNFVTAIIDTYANVEKDTARKERKSVELIDSSNKRQRIDQQMGCLCLDIDVPTRTDRSENILDILTSAVRMFDQNTIVLGSICSYKSRVVIGEPSYLIRGVLIGNEVYTDVGNARKGLACF
ncbi:38644_t:CDS:2 [Gigaspora margarita]|uniref:38644_t:CDS:1 n=1 Tax=Gigaspora margarita TaxID=4874 RepID=A0ABN7UTJ5_GIGMA|nr:38644_t:CDS:2 [Gigaspora margarita]